MAGTTAISWTATVLPDGTSIPGATFNPWTGCFKVSDGCKHCYASDQRKRYGHTNEWGPVATSLRTVTSDAYWKQPLKWDRQAKESGIRRKVFCASLADVFEDVGDHHPQVTEARQRLWWLIQQTPYLDWLLLTKRPENVLDMVPSKWLMRGFPNHVWIGTSVEHQAAAEERIPELLKIPARVRFLSCEPLLGPLDLSPWIEVAWWEEPERVQIVGMPGGVVIGERPGRSGWHHVDNGHLGVHWIIVGGESGPHYRPMREEWALSLRDQCRAARIPFFYKQTGGRTSGAGGHLLDGQEYHEWPEEVSYASAK